MARSQVPSVGLDRTARSGGPSGARGSEDRTTGTTDRRSAAASAASITEFSRRRLGRVLIAFGASGLAIILATAVVLVAVATSPMFDASSPAVLDDALAHAQVSVSQGAAAAASASQTLATTRDSTVATAQLLSELAATMRQGSNALRVDVLGQQPFTQMADSFSRTADRADAAATAIAQTGAGVDETRQSLDALSASLAALAADLHVARAPLPDRSTVSALFALLALLLGWLALIATGCLALGVRLVRRPA